MKHNQRKNMINAIQQNLKQMRIEAQHYIDKHHSSLPPICTARHYLFHTINTRPEYEGISQLKSSISSKLNREIKNKQKQENETESQSSPKRAIYNLELNKKLNDSYLNQSVRKDNINNSTSMKLKLGNTLKTGRYSSNTQDVDARINAEMCKSLQKVKTILMNSQLVDQSQNQSINHYNFTFTPKLTRLHMPKRQSQILKQYIDSFKQNNKSQQINNEQPKNKQQTNLQNNINNTSTVISTSSNPNTNFNSNISNYNTIQNTNTIQQNKSVVIPQNSIPQQILILRQNIKNIRKRKQSRKLIENPENSRRQKIRLIYQNVPNLRRKKYVKKQYDITQGDYTPWRNTQNADQGPNVDFP